MFCTTWEQRLTKGRGLGLCQRSCTHIGSMLWDSAEPAKCTRQRTTFKDASNAGITGRAASARPKAAPWHCIAQLGLS